MIEGGLYICNDCGAVFENPKKICGHGTYTRHDWDSPDEYVCPACGSDYFSQASRCEECKDVYADDYLTYGLCECCIKELAKKHAVDFVADDDDAFDSFAFWLHCRRGRDKVVT